VSDHLYRVHGDLTIKSITDGLTAAERRRLARVRRALDRLQLSELPHLRLAGIVSRRKGRARRRAWRQLQALSARTGLAYHTKQPPPP
jgi:hypothetical protein